MTAKTLPHSRFRKRPTDSVQQADLSTRPNPSQVDTSRHSKLNRKSGYHLPHKARSTPTT